MKWLPLKKLNHAKLFKSELDQYMHEMVRKRREEINLGEEKKDLLSALVKAAALQQSEVSSGKGGSLNGSGRTEVMDDEELIGNMFIFLLAGHETSEWCHRCLSHVSNDHRFSVSIVFRFTHPSPSASSFAGAHTMAFAFGLLALYPEEQDKLYAQIKEVMPDDEAEIPYSDYSLFTRALAVMHETLRIFPSVIAVPKRVTTLQDTILPCTERGPKGATRLFLPAGTHVSLEVQALHHDCESLLPA